MLDPVSTPDQARRAVDGTMTAGGTSSDRGEELYRFVKQHRFTRCLELGFYQGVSSVYIGAALESNGQGTLTSVDLPSALELSPRARDVVARAGLAHRVSLEIDPDSYIWWLRRRMRECVRDGRVQPAFDFVFLDGAHTWDVDGFAFALVDRLLAPGGWLLFDDLDWTPRGPMLAQVPRDVRALSHVGEIWELLVETDASYDELRTDGAWGYAHKSLAPRAEIRTVVKHDLINQIRQLARLARRRLPGRGPAVPPKQ